MLPLITLASLLAFSYTTDAVNYTVVAPVTSGQSVGVFVDNQTYPLTASADCPLLYTGSAPAASSGQYQYVKLDSNGGVIEKESFDRPAADDSTLNEFYNRTWNNMDIPSLPNIIDPIQSLSRNDTQLHIDGQIPTIYFSASESAINKLNDVSKSKGVSMDMTYISPDKIETFKKVNIGVSGNTPKSRFLPKSSYEVRITEKEKSLGSYKHLLLRSLSSDPSYIREQISSDVIRAAGLAMPGYSYARLFINNRPYGLFGLMEDYRNNWLNYEFGNGSAVYFNGALFSGDNNATLDYLGHDAADYNTSTNGNKLFPNNVYSIKQDADSRQSRTSLRRLIGLTKFLINTTRSIDKVDDVTAWNRKLDTSSFLRSAALEILLGNTNGYITAAQNYFIYNNPHLSRSTFIPSTMENTMGNTICNVTDMWSGNYSTYPGFKNVSRPLLHQIMTLPEFAQEFDNLMIQFSQELINPDVINERIDAIAEIIKKDVAWDSTIARNYAKIGDSEITANDMFGTKNTTPEMNAFAARALNGTINFEMAINGTSDDQDSIVGVKEWFSKQYSAVAKNMDTTTTAIATTTTLGVAPIITVFTISSEPTSSSSATLSKRQAIPTDSPRQIAPLSSGSADLPETFTRQTAPLRPVAEVTKDFTRQTSPLKSVVVDLPENLTRQTSPLKPVADLSENFTRQTAPLKSVPVHVAEAEPSNRQTAPLSSIAFVPETKPTYRQTTPLASAAIVPEAVPSNRQSAPIY